MSRKKPPHKHKRRSGGPKKNTPKQLANLIPFKPGVSGNPNGRPKIPDLKEVLADVLSQEKDGKNLAQRILEKMGQVAMQGNVRAAELVLDRTYGKAQQSIAINSESPQQITGFIIKSKPKEQ